MAYATSLSSRRVLILASVALVASAAVAAPPRGAVRRLLRGVPPPSVHALQRVETCEGLRAAVTDAMVEQLVRLWLGHYRFLDTVPVAGGEKTADPIDYTTTNNQESGVDELDIVKTDGWYLYVAMDGWLRVVRSWPADESEELAAIELSGYTHGLFLRRNLVAVLYDSSGVRPTTDEWRPGTRLDLLDVSDRTSPRLLRTIEVEGSLVGARRIDGRLYMVTSTWLPLPTDVWELLWKGDLKLPEVPWDAPAEERERAAAQVRAILRPHVEKIVAVLDLDDVIPDLRDRNLATGQASEQQLLTCDQVFRPAEASSYGMLSVLHLDLDEAAAGGGEMTGVGLLADGWTVYASARNLYIANGQPWWWWMRGGRATAEIHKLSLGQPETPVRYVASGQVPGYLLDQFALSEHNGDLRVASTELVWWWTPEDEDRPGSMVTVLRDDGRGALARVGQVKGIAPGERIFAARFMGDVGFLVTFEQVDPLFTLDLSDPTAPRVLGELVMPGFSTYLHPMTDGYLLAVGRAEDEEGALNELAINVFDVRDLANPRLAHQHVVKRGGGSWSWSEALWDHHAFTYRRGVLSIPVGLASRGRSFSGLAVFGVDLATGVIELGRVDHADMTGPDGWTWMRRSIYVEDYLYSLSNAGVKTSVLQRPADVVATVPFHSSP